MQVMNVNTHAIHHHAEAVVLSCLATSKHAPRLIVKLVIKRLLEHLTYFYLGFDNPLTG